MGKRKIKYIYISQDKNFCEEMTKKIQTASNTDLYLNIAITIILYIVI